VWPVKKGERRRADSLGGSEKEARGRESARITTRRARREKKREREREREKFYHSM